MRQFPLYSVCAIGVASLLVVGSITSSPAFAARDTGNLGLVASNSKQNLSGTIPRDDRARKAPQKRPLSLTLDSSRRDAAWLYPSKTSARFQIKAQRLPGSRFSTFVINRVPSRQGLVDYTLPWSARGDVQVRVLTKTKVGKKVRWAPGPWSKPALIRWGTSVSIIEAISAGGSTKVTLRSDARNVNVQLGTASDSPTDDSSLTSRTVSPALGIATINVPGVFDTVTAQATTGGQAGSPVTAVVAKQSISLLRAPTLEPNRVVLTWSLVGGTKVVSVTRSEGSGDAAAPGTGISVPFDGSSLTDRDVEPDRDYTYTVLSEGPLGEEPPITIQVHTPGLNDATDRDAWVLSPNTHVLQGDDFNLAPRASSSRAPLRPAYTPIVPGSTAELWIDWPGARGRNVVGSPIILPANKARGLPGGFVGVIIEQSGSRVRVIQGPVSRAVTVLNAKVLPNEPRDRARQDRTAGDFGCNIGAEFSSSLIDLDLGNRQVFGDVQIEGLDSRVQLRVTIDATISGSLDRAITGGCTYGIPIPDIPFAAGPVPMLARFSTSVGVNVTIPQPTGKFTRTYRVGLDMLADRNGLHPNVIREEILRSTELLDKSWSVSLKGTVGLQVGPGVGADVVGVVAGITYEHSLGIQLNAEPGDAFSLPGETCIVLAPLFTVSAGIAATLFVDAWAWKYEKDLFRWSVNLLEMPIPPGKQCIFHWGNSVTPGPDDAIEGDFDADGIRDRSTFKKFKSPLGEWGRLSVTASSTGKTATIDIGASDTYWQFVDYSKTMPIDGRPGVEAAIYGVMGANSQFAYFVTWQDGKLEFISPPGQEGSQWNSLYKWWGFDYHVRRVDQGRVIVSNLNGDLRTERETEVLTITQYEWEDGDWTQFKREVFSFSYPRTVANDFDLSPYGTSF